jgi:MFS family permease
MLFLLAWVHNYYLALLFLALAGWGMLLFFSTTNTVLQTSASDEMRGRVMGIWTLVFGGTTPLGGLEAGAVSHWLGVRWAVTVGSIVCSVAALIVLLLVQGRDRAQASPGPAR